VPGGRTTSRDGYRDRGLETRLETPELRVPKLRQGLYFPGFLGPRRTYEKTLVTVMKEAWFGGVSTRRVDEIVQAIGLRGISKSKVSRLCVRHGYRTDRDPWLTIAERVGEFLDRTCQRNLV
jgi:putative transposase